MYIYIKTLIFRHSLLYMISERQKAVQQRDPAMYSMEVEVQFTPLPPHVKAMVKKRCIKCTLFYIWSLYILDW